MPSSTAHRDYLTFIDSLMREYFALFPEEKGRLSVLLQQIEQEDPNICLRSNLPGHLTASALVLNPIDDTLLLIRHKFLQRWLQPGGHMDPGELPLTGALRELSEEVGAVPVSVHPWHSARKIPIDIDSHAIPANTAKAEPAHLHHDFQYIMVVTGEHSVTLQADEVSAFRWVSNESVQSGEFGERLARTVRKMHEFNFFQP
jgi:8-oxo-dGTP pyrophosphatase MutT (NUDIX family)